ncbi:hypothetical protein [Stenotrophomonas daejeonensis]|uniref:hypothetical protein n=1 Tax=Stenotrophomonas daejeonensis TaxID=659018 RepID=UPI0009FA4FC6|nr:hypothetical protein [Stenotrophomonas daejeonensis]
MAIHAVGARYGEDDVSQVFIDKGIVGTGWTKEQAPDLHEYFRALKVGDIVYLKSASSGSGITVKGIGVISDSQLLTATNTGETVKVGRNAIWLNTENFALAKPPEKFNVRANTAHEEFHPDVQVEILKKLKQSKGAAA